MSDLFDQENTPAEEQAPKTGDFASLFDDEEFFQDDERETFTFNPGEECLITFGRSKVAVPVREGLNLAAVVESYGDSIGLVIKDIKKLMFQDTTQNRYVEPDTVVQPGVVYRVSDSVDDKGLVTA